MRIVNLIPFLLTPHCVRFAVRMPRFWLRRRVCNWRGFNVFAFDYPLICYWFFGRYLNGPRLGVAPPNDRTRPLIMLGWNLTRGFVAIRSVISPFALMREATARSRICCAG